MDYNSQFKINRLEDENAFLKRALEKVTKENKTLKSQVSMLKTKLKKAENKILVYKHNISKSNISILRNLSSTISSNKKKEYKKVK